MTATVRAAVCAATSVFITAATVGFSVLLTPPSPETLPPPALEVTVVVDGKQETTLLASDRSQARKLAAQLYPDAAVSTDHAGEREQTTGWERRAVRHNHEHPIPDGALSAPWLVKVETLHTVGVVADGKVRYVTTTVDRAPQVLAEAGVRKRGQDKVRVQSEREGQLGTGDKIVLTRVAKQVRTTRVALRRPVKVVEDPTLEQGETEIRAVGRDGVKIYRVERTLHDGKAVSARRQLISRRAPSPRVKVVGTAPAVGEPTATPYGSVSADAASLNWAALAVCESTNRPTVVSANGLYHGLYQFNVQTWLSVGGTGLPSQASPQEQTYRAQRLYESRGAQPWPVCGRHLTK